MKLWKKLLMSVALAAGLTGGAQAASGGVKWDKAPVDMDNLASLQNGARVFVNYCLGCHSASFVRYNRLMDIGLTEQQIKDNLLITSDKVGDHMRSTINPIQAKAWFGANPPDLTLVARSRAGAGGTGADYLYTLFRTYYRDDTKPTGWNNLTFPGIGMPHPLWELEGEKKPVYETHKDGDKEIQVFSGKWEPVAEGVLDQQQYEKTVGDLVNFLHWMAEPAQQKRKHIGLWVMAFMLFFAFLAWKLNAAYWKDVR